MIAVLVALLISVSSAQAPRDARVTITVVDQTGAVIPNATVTVTPLTATLATVPPPAHTSDKGVAALQGACRLVVIRSRRSSRVSPRASCRTCSSRPASGVMTSTNFRQPTSVAGVRKVDIGLGLAF